MKSEERRPLWKDFRVMPAIGVVLSVAILGAAACTILLPLLAPPRDGQGGRSHMCMNNLKACALALHSYCQDYDGWLPSSQIVSGAREWDRGDFVRFASGPALPSHGHPRTTWSQVLYNHTKCKDIVFCPSDAANPPRPDSRVSYWWKAAVDRAWYGSGCTKPQRRMAEFPKAADQIVLYERAGFHGEFPQGLRDDVQINVVCLDTHVKRILPATYIDPSRYSDRF